MTAAFVLVALAAAGWLTAQVATGGWRRILIRSEWATIMRSCGLAQRRDRETTHKPGAGEKTSPTRQIEHLPRLWALWGRPLGPLTARTGATYRIWAAKGQTIDEIAKKAEAIASSLHCQRVIVDRYSPRRGRITILWKDPFTIPKPWAQPIHGSTSPCFEVTGRPLVLPLNDNNGGSWLVAGAPGGGKSAWINALVADWVRQPGDTRWIYGIDIKRVELGPWAPAFQAVARNRNDATEILKRARAFIDQRYTDLEQAGLHGVPLIPTPEWPYLVLVIEELSALLSGEGEQVATLKQLLAEIAELGRAAGVLVIAASQKPTSDIVPSRFANAIPRRVLLRVPTIEHAKSILGWTPTQAELDQLTTNGLALLDVPGRRLHLARSTYEPIQSAVALAAQHAIHPTSTGARAA